MGSRGASLLVLAAWVSGLKGTFLCWLEGFFERECWLEVERERLIDGLEEEGVNLCTRFSFRPFFYLRALFYRRQNFKYKKAITRCKQRVTSVA